MMPHPARRTVKPEPRAPGRAKPVIRVRPREERTVRAGRLIAVLLVGCGALSFAVFRHEKGPDPHYEKARKLITDYERGREPATLDYEAPSYDEALAELGKVPEGSVSSEVAEQLSDHIRTRKAAQKRRLEARRRDAETRLEKRRRREEAFMRSQRRGFLDSYSEP